MIISDLVLILTNNLEKLDNNSVQLFVIIKKSVNFVAVLRN